MSTQSWVTLIACVGELAVVLLVALRASGSRAGHAAAAAQHRPGGLELRAARLPPLGAIGWHLRRHDRCRRWRPRSRFISCSGSWDARASCAGRCGAVYLYFGLIAATAAGGLLSPSVRQIALSHDLELVLAGRAAPPVGHHGHGAGHPPPPRRQRRGAKPHLAVAGGGDGHLAARVERGVGRPRLPRPPPRQRRDPVVQRDPDAGGAALPAVRQGAVAVGGAVGDGRRRGGRYRLSLHLPRRGHQHRAAGARDADRHRWSCSRRRG